MLHSLFLCFWIHLRKAVQKSHTYFSLSTEIMTLSEIVTSLNFQQNWGRILADSCLSTNSKDHSYFLLLMVLVLPKSERCQCPQRFAAFSLFPTSYNPKVLWQPAWLPWSQRSWKCWSLQNNSFQFLILTHGLNKLISCVDAV